MIHAPNLMLNNFNSSGEHSFKLIVFRSKQDKRKYSLTVLILSIWTSISKNVVSTKLVKV